MTVVGLVHEGVVWLAADALWPDGELRRASAVPGVARLKVRREDGGNVEALVAGTGSRRLVQRVQRDTKLPKYKPKEHSPLDWALELADRIQELVGERKGGNDGDGNAKGALLVGFQGRVFEIGKTYDVDETACGYTAIGSGAAVALGALYATRDEEPERRLLLALRAAARHSERTSAPFQTERLAPASARGR